MSVYQKSKALESLHHLMSKYTSFFSYTIQNKYNYDIDMKYLHNSMLQYDIFSFFTISTNKQKKRTRMHRWYHLHNSQSNHLHVLIIYIYISDYFYVKSLYNYYISCVRLCFLVHRRFTFYGVKWGTSYTMWLKYRSWKLPSANLQAQEWDWCY